MSQPSRRRILKQAAASVSVLAAAGEIPSDSRKASAGVTPLRSLPIIAKRTTTSNSVYKQRAIADYRRNMERFGGALSRHGSNLLRQPTRPGRPTNFEILVIGSGYGASICAARLSIAKQPGVRLGVLERGKEWVPGTFNDVFRKTTGESRFRLLGPKKGTVENPVGLVNAMQNDEVNVLSGSGLGGSSLINANVAIRPDRECFEQLGWPTALRDRSVLDPFYDLAALELGVVNERLDASPKMRAQRLASQRLAHCGGQFQPAGITVTRGRGNQARVNRQGLIQRPCIDCGDCNSGCNVGAKNTLAMNYLPLARQYGAELYTHTEVIRIQKEADHYRVYFKNYIEQPHGEFKTTCGSITSRIVVLGAGSVGSSEILLRSRGCGMELSGQVGKRWTMNGDALGFVLKSKHFTNSAGRGAYPSNDPPVGPTIQSNLTYPNRELKRRVLIQEGSVTRGYANILGALMGDAKMDDTLIMLGMGHDGAGGRIELRPDGLGTIKWPGIKESAYRKMIRNEFAKVARAHEGQYKYLKAFGDNFITVHPLGGNAMADDPMHGVVDERGRVFDGLHGGQTAGGQTAGGVSSHTYWTGTAAVHNGLYVADGSIIPNSIGCNPLLTISALAERIAKAITIEEPHRDLFT